MTLAWLALLFFTPVHAENFKYDSLHESAPDLILTGEKTVHLSQYKGKRVILHFWASWCNPCKRELPALEKAVTLTHEKDLIFIPVATDEPSKSESAKKFLASIILPSGAAPIPFWLASDAGPYISWGVPVTYFIDANQNIRARIMGCREWVGEIPWAKLFK